MGDVVLADLLRERSLLPEQAHTLDYYIVAVTEAERPLQRRIASRLRANGSSVGYGLREAGVRAQFKDADARGALNTIVLGPAEVSEGIASLRNLRTKEETRLPLAELTGEPGGDGG
jgi:histidyl-tRNA synthetase